FALTIVSLFRKRLPPAVPQREFPCYEKQKGESRTGPLPYWLVFTARSPPNSWDNDTRRCSFYSWSWTYGLRHNRRRSIPWPLPDGGTTGPASTRRQPCATPAFHCQRQWHRYTSNCGSGWRHY